MKIVSWNINSVRLRINLLKQLINKENPDIICLQETKVVDELFPLKEIESFGYPYIAISGEKSYNGVAIISKFPLSDICTKNMLESGHKRHISAKIADFELHNFYVPAGGDEPNIKSNPKFAFKLDFLDEMYRFFTKYQSSDKLVMVGDLNIAPLEHDVWSHKQMLAVISHTPIEVEKLNFLQSDLGWCDALRYFIPESQKLYSWWSYRASDWRKSDRGRRLDHIWVTKNLTERLKSGYIMKDTRDWSPPSDHVPVIIELLI